jgi:hypothetical protein
MVIFANAPNDDDLGAVMKKPCSWVSDSLHNKGITAVAASIIATMVDRDQPSTPNTVRDNALAESCSSRVDFTFNKVLQCARQLSKGRPVVR